MLPLYIPATNTIIRDYAHRYIHPITAEVYGRGDYDDASKLAEIGAVPLIIQEVASEHIATAWEVVLENGSYFYRPVATVIDEAGLIAKAWEAANNHAMSEMDLNSRSSLLWMSMDPACPEWRMARIVAVRQWWESIWEHYGTVKTMILSGFVTYYDPAVAGKCPWTIWEIQVNE
jgi:hypothetical protein